MKTLVKSLSLFISVIVFSGSSFAQTGIVDIPLNTEKAVVTAPGVTGLPASLGSPQEYVTVLRLAALQPGRKYEATLTYDAGTETSYGHAWLDGNPFEQDWISFVGIVTGTGSQEMQGKQEKFIFTIDPKSTSGALYLAMRTNKPFTFRFSISDRLSGVTRDSQDRWGYYYVTDFDADRHSPFLLVRGQGAVPVSQQPAVQGPWVDIPVNGEKTVTTAQGLAGLPSSLGNAEDYVTVLRLAQLMPGKKYEATLTYDAGTDIGYGHAWVDGSPFDKDWASFVGIGTGTGTREMQGKQEKFIFTIDPQSSSSALYVAMRTNKPFTFRFGLSDRLSGVTRDSQDRWGYYYVTDFDADQHSPFLLKR